MKALKAIISASTMVPILIATILMLIGVIVFQQYITNQLYISVSNISNMVCPAQPADDATANQ